MFDVMDGQCASEQLNSPYCNRVGHLQNLVVARDSTRELIFMRLQGSGRDVSFDVAKDANNFIEMQALLRQLDKHGFVSSVTFHQKTNQYLSTHYGLLGQICVTTIINKYQSEYKLSSLIDHI